MNVRGSIAFTPNRKLCKTRVAADAPATPSATPASTGSMPSFNTKERTSPGSAPNAMRIPSSRVRLVTECEITEYMPIAASSDARPANIPSSQVVSRNEMGGFIRLEQNVTHWTTFALRYDYYTPDTAQSFDGRHTGAFVGVVVGAALGSIPFAWHLVPAAEIGRAHV